MVSVNDIVNGITKYIDTEFLALFPETGFQRVMIGAAAAIVIKKRTPEAVSIVKALGLMDADGNVDIDTLKTEVQNHMPADGIKMEVPSLGVITFKKEDIDKLYKYIVG